MQATVKILLCGLLLLLLSSCSDLGYYLQCARGQWEIVQRTRPIESLLNDPQTPTEQRLRLARALEIRNFASSALALPDNDSYREFADIGRPYVVWNVVAAPEFNVQPVQWCFPVAGCVAYRGYFDEPQAARFAEEMAARGYEVDVYGVQAYSTLRWFDDPVLNTFLDGDESSLAGMIFHELAHQVYYVADDSRFNEAFAKVVEREGVRRWLQQGSDPRAWNDYLQRRQRVEQFIDLLLATRDDLEDLYAQILPAEEMRVAKRAIFAGTLAGYDRLKSSWGGYDGFDHWFDRGLNNARLTSLATYRDLVPAFEGLLDQQGGDLNQFFAVVREIGALPRAERLARLQQFVPSRHVRLAGGSNP